MAVVCSMRLLNQRFHASRLSQVLRTRFLSSSAKLVDWRVDEERRIGTLTLQSPETFNALTEEMGTQFQETCRDITEDLTIRKQEVSAIILRGAGNRAFSAGGNIDWLKSLKHNSVSYNADLMLRFYKSFLCVRSLPVPVIAALQGPAIGAGAGLALACDLRTGQTDQPKLLGFNFTTLGIHSGMGSSHFLSKVLGGKATLLNEILLTGKILSSQECWDAGLLNRLSNDCLADAQDLAEAIGRQHPTAVRSMLKTLRTQQNQGLEDALQSEAMSQAVCYQRHDWGEGVSAVAEKRLPVFDGYHSQSKE